MPDRMFETRSDAWEAVGLSVDVSKRAVRRAQREALVLFPLAVGLRDRLPQPLLAARLAPQAPAAVLLADEPADAAADRRRDRADRDRLGTGQGRQPFRRPDVHAADGSGDGGDRRLRHPAAHDRHHGARRAERRRGQPPGAGRRRRIHGGRRRSRRPADARQRDRRDGAAERPAVPGRRADPAAGRRRRRLRRGDRQLARPALHDAHPRCRRRS